jgi:hypothetical protein
MWIIDKIKISQRKYKQAIMLNKSKQEQNKKEEVKIWSPSKEAYYLDGSVG